MAQPMVSLIHPRNHHRPSGNVYVADTGNNRIQKFDSSGTFPAKWGNNGSADGEFYYPHGVASDTTDSIYVADSGNNRIQKFALP